MLERILKVQYLYIKNSFCYLSLSVTKEIGTNIVKIIHEDNREAYFSLGSPSPNLPDDTIGINSLYAKHLGIEEHDTVMLSEISTPSKVKSFTIYPVRCDDFHVLDMLRAEVENCILGQTKVVSSNQGLIIWIGDNLNIPVKVVSVDPASPGILDNLAELIILPQPLNKNGIDNYIESDEEVPEGIEDEIQHKGFNDEIFIVPEVLTDKEAKTEKTIQVCLNHKVSFYGRLVPFEVFQSLDISKYFYEFSVFILKTRAPPVWKKLDSFKEPILCSLEIPNNPDAKTIFVRVFLIEEDNVAVKLNNIFIHNSLFTILNCKTGASALLKASVRKHVDEIIIHRKNKTPNVKDLLKDYLADLCQKQDFVLNAEIPICLDNHLCCSLKFKPESKYCWVDKEFLRNCKYKIEDDPSVTKLPVQVDAYSKDFIEIASHRSICDSILQNFKTDLMQNMELRCALITGNNGSGKSMVIDEIKNSLLHAPFFIYSETVRCKTLKGKTQDSLHRVFVTLLETLIVHQPSVLFLDDLHVLCENIAENDALAQNALYYNRISEMLYLFLTSAKSHNLIGIFATTNSIDKLNKYIYSSRGFYLFENIYLIEDLTKRDRSNILEYFLKDRSIGLDFESLSQKTEGYVFQDLFDFTQKAGFQSIKNDPDNAKVKEEDCEEALSQMTILSLTDVKLHSPGNRDFSDIGGLGDIKNLLSESLLWPLKYPNLFESAPLRIQSGLLLYGPPGTGKTLLAAAAAKQCGIRLISIKGPELLSKYIGASEQAVRDVFIQAQNAKPCILFFDEFDSLAPRRGHDITGVTDRVVNQLLTQMDGVESLTGVFVLAATSRPDLLDPALLRPGRLDKQILCPLPDLESRIDILKVLSKSLNLSDDVDIAEIAKDTDGFSGADLQSLLYNAQLSTMEHLLLSEDNKVDSDEQQPITQELLKKSLSKTKPSLTKEEKKKYDFIYFKFQGKTDLSYLKPGTKASLA